jgi:hypothetical protein
MKEKKKKVYDSPQLESIILELEQCIAASGDSTLNDLIANELADEGV